MLVASCLVSGGCAFNFQLPGANKSHAKVGFLSNRVDTSFGEAPRAVKELPAIRGREYDFVLYSVKEDGKYCLTADNRREAPVSVFIELSREENVATDRSFPFEYVVPPNTRQCIARISPLYKDREFSFQSANSWMPGDYTARNNPKEGYRLPWRRGESYLVSQAYGGPITTHTDPSSRFAVDFSMPVGTPVMSARAGIVVNMEDSYSGGALDKALLDKANFVDILHDDGTIATYSHLAERSLAVHLGQLVSAGEKLGLSGSTGYSSGPHLHFAVWRPEYGVKGYAQLSLMVEFCTDGKKSCTPVEYGTVIPKKSTAARR